MKDSFKNYGSEYKRIAVAASRSVRSRQLSCTSIEKNIASLGLLV